MPTVDVVVESEISTSVRARQVSAMFDVPAQEKCTLRWSGELPIEAAPWNVGLVIGPSGSGKSTIARSVFGAPVDLEWRQRSVIDDFPASSTVDDIATICQAVGFNTIPAWLRPYAVLSNGEKFRVDLARRLLELPDPVVVDEFTSVVDRQVAQIGSHAVQKFVRRAGRRFVAVTCHYDVIDWLQPDWILEAATMQFSRRLLQQRPPLECSVARVAYDAWRLFAPYHYLTGELHRSARCFCLFVGDRPAAFAGMLHRPHARVDDIMGCSRLVTLPDWQGLGLAMALIDVLGAAYRGVGKRLHTYPAHPALVRTFDRSPHWRLEKAPGTFQGAQGRTKDGRNSSTMAPGVSKQRPCAVFEWCGPATPRAEAARLLG